MDAAYVRNITPECVYCGERAQSRDHIPPLRFAAEELGDVGPVLWQVVGACLECNACLGSRPLMTLAARRKYLVGEYRKRYASALKGPVWTADELAELGHALRSAVVEQEAERSRAARRIRRLRGDPR